MDWTPPDSTVPEPEWLRVPFDAIELPSWLRDFVAKPSHALDKLLRGTYHFGSLQGADPDILLTDWGSGLHSEPTFVELLDGSMEGWISANWGVQANDEDSRNSLSTAWERLGNIAAGLDYLVLSRESLRERFLEARGFLLPLVQGHSNGPLGTFYLATAGQQQNLKLESEWISICSLTDELPYRYIPFGIRGVLGLPRAQESEKSAWRQRLNTALIEAATSLCRLWRSGRLSDRLAPSEMRGILSVVRPEKPDLDLVWQGVLEREPAARTYPWLTSTLGLESPPPTGIELTVAPVRPTWQMSNGLETGYVPQPPLPDAVSFSRPTFRASGVNWGLSNVPLAAALGAFFGAAATALGASVGAPAAAVASKRFVWGTGRRKTATARVRIREGTGRFEINGLEVNNYFFEMQHRHDVRDPLAATEMLGRVDVFVNVKGSGKSSQSRAVLLGVARALSEFRPDLEGPLKAEKFLTRDSRKVERKKYGHKKARKRFQFSKR